MAICDSKDGPMDLKMTQIQVVVLVMPTLY